MKSSNIPPAHSNTKTVFSFHSLNVLCLFVVYFSACVPLFMLLWKKCCTFTVCILNKHVKRWWVEEKRYLEYEGRVYNLLKSKTLDLLGLLLLNNKKFNNNIKLVVITWACWFVIVCQKDRKSVTVIWYLDQHSFGLSAWDRKPEMHPLLPPLDWKHLKF